MVSIVPVNDNLSHLITWDQQDHGDDNKAGVGFDRTLDLQEGNDWLEHTQTTVEGLHHTNPRRILHIDIEV